MNTNYRYSADELVYLWDNADAVAVVFHGHVHAADRGNPRPRPGREAVAVGGRRLGSMPGVGEPYEDAATQATRTRLARWGRSGDDLYMLYTGGTTGMPKGVMWQMGDLSASSRSNAGGDRVVAAGGARSDAGPACPLMHGTGAFTSFIAMNLGWMRSSRRRSARSTPAELLETIEHKKVEHARDRRRCVREADARELDANQGSWDLSSLFMMISSGVMWSEETKQGLLKHHPAMMLNDAFSSSEALGMGTSMSTGDRRLAHREVQAG